MKKASDVVPVSQSVKSLAEAVVSLMKADEELALAKSRVPAYTGGNSREDYVADEQSLWNKAAQSLHDLVFKNNRLGTDTKRGGDPL